MELHRDFALPLRDAHHQHHRPSDPTSDLPQTDPSPAPTSVEASSTSRSTENVVEKVRDTITMTSGDRVEAMSAAVKTSRPLRLLDLPLDILSMIVKEITHTNDLCAIALSHSALHSLAIPHIYSRFDIVWPDASTTSETRSGVDALTYGLATLVMAEDVFGEASFQQQKAHTPATTSACSHCVHCNTSNTIANNAPTVVPLGKRKRRGNNYATFTRKFSLGNGPGDWVQEYRVTSDSGKMLGSLVALAIARMKNLESFIWDMPTGVLRDVWQALASLGDRDNCRLERLWIRWHSNATVDGNIAPPRSPAHEHNAFPQPVSAAAVANGTNDAGVAKHNIINKVERSTFSILSPLKSLNVLDIDELAYLDEMSVLISSSRHTLRELRVGIAKEASGCDWTGAWEGGGLQQVPAKTANPLGGTNHFEKRLGGILGVLVAHTYNLRPQASHNPDGCASLRTAWASAVQPPIPTNETRSLVSATIANLETDQSLEATITRIMADESLKNASESVKVVTPRFIENLPPPDAPSSRSSTPTAKKSFKTPVQNPEAKVGDQDHENFRLGVTTLELERVPLSVSVLCGAFDWSKLTDLTLLDCPNHEQLWKVLRRKFSPKSLPVLDALPTSPSNRRLSKTAAPMDYELKLRKIHTNTVTNSLISFLKETLAPNSLEALFLQQSRYYMSKVSIDAIFRGPLRRHRGSLKQLSLDSRSRDRDGTDAPAIGYGRWEFDRELLTWITSGRLPRLRELAVSLDLKDWHFFLQRLQWIPHLRSLFIPFIAKDITHIGDHEAREMALQIIDIVTMRPEIELCYLAIAGKCFEVLEARPVSRGGRRDSDTSSSLESESDGSEEDDNDVDEDDDDGGDGANNDADISGFGTGDDGEETETEEESASDGDDDSDIGAQPPRSQLRLRLREILFYDDKIAIFKARHGRL